MQDTSRKVLFIDNFDSFTYNLVDDFCKRDCRAKVYRADTALEELKVLAEEFEPDLLVISPGPGTPDTAGVSLSAVGYFKEKLPILGVCLGHQVIVQHFGGKFGHAPEPMHGILHELLDDIYSLAAPVTRVFQHYTLGSQGFAATFDEAPDFESESLLATLDRLQARTVDLTELDVAQVAEGQPVAVTVDALPDLTLAGSVREIALQAGDYRGDVVYDLTVELNDVSDAPLRWGMTALVEIEAR